MTRLRGRILHFVCLVLITGVAVLWFFWRLQKPNQQENVELVKNRPSETSEDFSEDSAFFYTQIGTSENQVSSQPQTPQSSTPAYTVELFTTENRQVAEKSVIDYARQGIDVYFVVKNNGTENEPKFVYHIRRGYYSDLKSAQSDFSKLSSLKPKSAKVVQF